VRDVAALWAKYSTTWWQDPKVMGLPPPAQLLYARAIAWCKDQLNDGVIDASAVPFLGMQLDNPAALAKAIAGAGLWQRHGRGYRFPPATWERWQGTRADVESVREYEASRKRAYRARQSTSPSTSRRDTNGTRGQRDAEPEPEPEPDPEPEQNATRPSLSLDRLSPRDAVQAPAAQAGSGERDPIPISDAVADVVRQLPRRRRREP
jgi:hypothetical protein